MPFHLSFVIKRKKKDLFGGFFIGKFIELKTGITELGRDMQ